MSNQIFEALLLAASALLWTGYKGVHQEQASTTSTTSSEPATPEDEQTQMVRQGQEIFDETPRYAPSYTGAKISCGDCHLHSGTEPYAAPMIEVAEQFPAYSERARR
jgi:thiosulfate dehydrogenase